MSQVFHYTPQSFELPEELEVEEAPVLYKAPEPEVEALPAQGTKEYDRMRSTGKIVFKPKRIEIEDSEGVKTGEVCIQTHDQQVYSVGKGGQLRNLSKPPRMSKKKRLAWRKQQLEESPAPVAK